MELKYLISGFVLIIVGVVLLTVIADSTAQVTTPYTITNETITIVREAADQLSVNETYGISTAFDDLVTDSVSVKYYNGTALILDTDYSVNYTTDKIYFINSSKMYNFATNKTGGYYQFYGDNYVTDTTSRVLTGLIILFFAIGLVLIVIAYVFKDRSLIDVISP